MSLKKFLAGAGIGVAALAAYLGFFPDNLTPEEIVNIETQAQELFGGDTKAVKQMIFNEMKPAKVKLKGKDWELVGANFKSLLKENAEDGWAYEENGKKLVFLSEGMAWDGVSVKTKSSKVSGDINELTVKYNDALGAGIDIKIVQDNYKFQKIIEIKSLASLGEIPEGTEYLEFSFKLSGDFDLPQGKINDRIPFGENSFLQPVRAWDSSEPTIDNLDPNLYSGAFGEITGNVITKKIPVAWLKQATFPISTDTTITFGSENVFNAATTDYSAVAALDTTHFVVCYRDNGNSSYGTCIIGVTDGNTTINSWGSESVFNTSYTNHISVVVLDSTHFVVVYRDTGNSSYGTARVALTDGSTAISSWGAENVYNSGESTYNSVDVLDSTHFVVGYTDVGNSSYGTAIVGVTSGTTISSYGTESAFNSAISLYVGVAVLDSTHFVAVYQDGGNSNHGTAIIGVTSGTTISSYGTADDFNVFASYMTVAALDSTHFVPAYRNTDGHGAVTIGVTDGSTAISSYGSESVFNAASTYYCAVSDLDSTHFVVGYRDSGNSAYGTGIVGLTDGSTAVSSYGAENVFNTAQSDYIYSAALDSTHFVITYQDDGNSSHGTAIVGSIPAPSPEVNSNFFLLF